MAAKSSGAFQRLPVTWVRTSFIERAVRERQGRREGHAAQDWEQAEREIRKDGTTEEARRLLERLPELSNRWGEAPGNPRNSAYSGA